MFLHVSVFLSWHIENIKFTNLCYMSIFAMWVLLLLFLRWMSTWSSHVDCWGQRDHLVPFLLLWWTSNYVCCCDELRINYVCCCDELWTLNDVVMNHALSTMLLWTSDELWTLYYVVFASHCSAVNIFLVLCQSEVLCYAKFPCLAVNIWCFPV